MIMVVISDVGSNHVASVERKKINLFEEKIYSTTAVDLKKCLEQIKLPVSLHNRASTSELPVIA